MRWKGALGLAISAVLIWWTLAGVSFAEVWAVVRAGDLLLLGASVLVATAGFLIRAFRWRVLLEPIAPGTSLDSRFGATTIGFMANNLLPARVGEFVRAYALGRMEAVSVSGAFGTLVVERSLDGLVLVTFFVVPVLLPGFPAAEGLGDGTLATLIRGMLVLLGGLAVFLAALLLWPTQVVRLAERVAARLPAKAARRAVDALEAFLLSLQVLRNPRLLAQAVLWSFAFWTWHGFSFYLGMAAFGIEEGFLAAIFTEAAVGFGVALPSAPGFFGTFHAAADWALSRVYGVEAARSLAFAYGYHLGGFFPVTLIGLWYARRLGLSLKDLGRSEERVEREVEADTPGAVRVLSSGRTDAAPGAVELEAPAKVNLVLRVLEREATGFHRIETIFQAVELADLLRVERVEEPGVGLEVTGFDAGPPEANLVVRAARAYLEEARLPSGVYIRLDKRVPAGAGLGGGSSDAAATLRAMQALFPGSLPGERVRELAAGLGSDVPFFLCGCPLALGRGRGELLEPLEPLPSVPVLLALPAIHVSTGAAYQALDAARGASAVPERPPLPGRLDGWERVAGLGRNDFEAVILPRHPVVRRARRALLDTGPLFALLSGSGSAVFAVYGDGEHARRALEALPSQGPVRFVLTRTRTAMPDPAPSVPQLERRPLPRLGAPPGGAGLIRDSGRE